MIERKHKLFELEVGGADSSDIESFPSYVWRLSFIHGLTVRKLVKYVHKHTVNYIGNEEKLRSVIRPFQVSGMLRPGKSNDMLLQIFEKMTSQNLRDTMLLFFCSLTRAANGEICNSFRWCPECISEMYKSQKIIYFKLLWQLNSVKHCSYHNAPLVIHCSNCHFKQDLKSYNYPPGFCEYCGRLLDSRFEPLKREEHSNSWELIGSDVIELFDDLFKYKIKSLPINGIKLSLAHLYDYYHNAGIEDEFFELLSKKEMLEIIKKDKLVSFKTARKIAFRTGVPIYSLISGAMNRTTATLNPNWVCKLPDVFVGKSLKNIRNHTVVLKKIITYLDDKKNPPPLKQLAEKLNVSVGYLCYQFPKLSKKIVNDHKCYKQELKLKKLYKAQSFALSYFLDEKYKEFPKSRKQACRILREETGLPKFVLKKAINVAYDAIYHGF